MTTAGLLALIERAGHKPTYEQFRTWVVTQSVRNALQAFHGRWAFDPDNPGSGEGFLSDKQMRELEAQAITRHDWHGEWNYTIKTNDP